MKSGEIVSRLTADTTQIKAAFGASASVALRNLVLFVGAVAMMVVTSPRLSALVLHRHPCRSCCRWWHPAVRVRQRSRLAQDTAGRRLRLRHGGRRRDARDAGLHGRESHAGSLLAAVGGRLPGRAARPRCARSILTAVAIFLIFSSVVGVLWYGAQDVLAARSPAARLSQFVLYAVFGAGALGELSQVWSEVAPPRARRPHRRDPVRRARHQGAQEPRAAP